MRCVALSEVATVAMGTAPPGSTYNENGEGLPLIAGAGDFGTRSPITKKWTSEPSRIAEPGDLIICVRATIGDLNWADRRYCLGRGVAGIRIDKRLTDAAYLARVLDAKRHDLAKLGTGSTFPAIRRADLEGFQIPLPTLPEQKRIAAILDAADALRAKRRESIEQLDSLVQATFMEMFGDPVANPKGWNVRKLGDICDVRDGTHDSPKYVDAGFPLLTSKNFASGQVDYTGAKLISEDDYWQINKRSAVGIGDLVMPMIGTIGNPVLITSKPDFAIKNVALIKFTADSPDQHYLRALLCSSYFDHVTAKANRGGTQKFVALKDLRGLPIPIPTRESQNRFASIVESIEQQKTRLKAHLAELDTLFASLQSRAFNGELVA
jgi:type I restriction enzyme S subunit